MMKSRLQFLAAVVFSVLALTVQSAEIMVLPGDGTIASAIASAADGDSLILGEGTYSGVATVDKSLTIRAESRAVHPAVSSALTISGEGIRVTIQGIAFSAAPVLVAAAEIRLLQNQFVDSHLDGTQYRTTEGDGSLIVIGNSFFNSNLTNVYSEDAYIAGNVVSTGNILAFTSAWIIGNDIYRVTDAAITVYGAFARVIGNRVICAGSGGGVCLYSNALSSVIANNVVDFRISNDSQVKTAIRAGQGVITNNVVTMQRSATTRYDEGIETNVPGARITGNIVVEFSYGAAVPVRAAAPAEITHNVCFNSDGDCPDGNGNLNVDPEFVDLIDYRLSPNSPAIDAGPLDYHLADLDRSRNDIGAYGGPWSIGQFDAQRDPYTLAPYVYPKFEGTSAVQGGEIAVQAIGVARLR